MNLPRLTEVFIIREASVGNISRILHLPRTAQDEIDQFFGHSHPDSKRYAFVLTKLFLQDLDTESGRKIIEQMKNGNPTARRAFIGFFKSWLKPEGETGAGKLYKVLQYLKKNPDFEKVLMKVDGSAEALSLIAQKSKKDISSRAAMQFPDGFYWVKLEGDDECDLEGGMMQHCGRSNGDMYSLRDKQGNPHATVDVQTPRKVGLPDDNPDQLQAFQIRGKQNHLPDKKYWRYLRDFFRREGIKPDDKKLEKEPIWKEFLKYYHEGED